MKRCKFHWVRILAAVAVLEGLACFALLLPYPGVLQYFVVDHRGNQLGLWAVAVVMSAALWRSRKGRGHLLATFGVLMCSAALLLTARDARELRAYARVLEAIRRDGCEAPSVLAASEAAWVHGQDISVDCRQQPPFVRSPPCFFFGYWSVDEQGYWRCVGD